MLKFLSKQSQFNSKLNNVRCLHNKVTLDLDRLDLCTWVPTLQLALVCVSASSFITITPSLRLLTKIPLISL